MHYNPINVHCMFGLHMKDLHSTLWSLLLTSHLSTCC